MTRCKWVQVHIPSTLGHAARAHGQETVVIRFDFEFVG